tara:strand:- start:6703 stop:7212 length:510 start_codon:yes stop_codon:yes gene_type:complete
MSETPYEPLNDALDIDYDPNRIVDKAEKDIVSLAKTSTKLSDATTLEDKEYMELEIKTLISSAKFVMDKLEEDVKIGAKPRVYEVYATLTKAVLDSIKELRELNLSIENLKLSKEKLNLKKEIGSTTSNTVNLQISGRDMFKMLANAKKQAEQSRSEVPEAEYDVLDNN